MSKRSSKTKSKRRSRTFPHWVSPACLSRWQAVRAPQPAKRWRMQRRPHKVRVKKFFSARRRSPTSAWRHSTSLTRKPRGFSPADNLPWEAEAAAAAVCAATTAITERGRRKATPICLIVRSNPRIRLGARTFQETKFTRDSPALACKILRRKICRATTLAHRPRTLSQKVFAVNCSQCFIL